MSNMSHEHLKVSPHPPPRELVHLLYKYSFMHLLKIDITTSASQRHQHKMYV